MISLADASKFAQEQSRRTSDVNAPMTRSGAQEFGSRVPSARGRRTVPSGIERLMAHSTPILTKGLEGLMNDGDLSSLNGVISLEGLIGLAVQFLPPWAGDALAVSASLASGDLAGAADALLSKYLPPELKAVYDAIKNLPGGWPEFLKWLSENPQEAQGAAGPHAARLSDIAGCPGGTGPIIEPCLPSVLIGGMPAARRGDTVLCNGLPTDKIAIGEPTVWMGGHQIFAARRNDATEHGGQILTGFATVHIGKKRGQPDMRLADKCLTDAADSGAATIGGAGINPIGEGGLLTEIAAGAADIAKKKLAEFVAQKATEAIGELFNEFEEPPKPQPPVPEGDDFTKTSKSD